MSTPQRSKAAEFLLSGTAACGAITLTNPIDVVKTRLQLQGELVSRGGQSSTGYSGIGNALLITARAEGIRGLQRGLSAAYFLQFSNVGCRFGGYNFLKSFFGVKPDQSASGWLSSIAMGGASGVLAAVVSSPFFLLKTRFQAVGSADVRYQHAHSTLREAFLDIGRTEGLRGYYRGLPAFVPRVAVASAVQLSTYDVSKQFIIRTAGTGDTTTTHFAASLLTGIAVTLAMQPFDFASVRLMNQEVCEAGRGRLYSGPFDCMAKTVRSEGVVGIYKGCLANYLRFGPYCILTFVFLEQLRTAWDNTFATS